MYPVINMAATGIRLRQIMKEKKMTARDVQRYLGLSCVQSVYRWLGGHSLPSVDHLYALSELFHMPMDQMIVGRNVFRMIYRCELMDRMAAYEEEYQVRSRVAA